MVFIWTLFRLFTSFFPGRDSFRVKLADNVIEDLLPLIEANDCQIVERWFGLRWWDGSALWSLKDGGQELGAVADKQLAISYRIAEMPSEHWQFQLTPRSVVCLLIRPP